MQSHFSLIWESVADAVPEHVALIQGGRRISWRDYEDRAARLAQPSDAAGEVLGVARVAGRSGAPLAVHLDHLAYDPLELGRGREGVFVEDSLLDLRGCFRRQRFCLPK